MMTFSHYSSGMAFIFLFPIVQILCFLYAVGGDIRGIKLAVVNDETMNNACNRTTFNGTAIPYDFSSCHFMDMSCRFLKHLDDHPMMKLVSVNSPSPVDIIHCFAELCKKKLFPSHVCTSYYLVILSFSTAFTTLVTPFYSNLFIRSRECTPILQQREQ